MNTTFRFSRTAFSRTAFSRTARAAALLTAAGLALTACNYEEERGEAAPPTAEVAQLSVEEAWIKAAEDGMTGAFGTLVNDGDRDLVVTGASSDAADEVELHEMAADEHGAMVMREVDGGFTVPAGGEYTLEPGGNHLMLMGLTGPVQPGDTVTIELKLEDGSLVDFEAPAKDFAGANENYDGGH
ncbi:hypothetical protein BN1051_02374 [Arthrobacter saudimassiliensis]|uniref:Copper chaperone PCu(A)C n=1 Tax=Arthrobacter saudimassiliensis TaxID=1461584 RepID=A0A078MVZ6_9MICC|nr:hypothetical protein BN1051_02374 [Arthrobacter saudimassiliensis]